MHRIFLLALSLLAVTYGLPTTEVDNLVPRTEEVCTSGQRLIAAANVLKAFAISADPQVTYQNFLAVGFTPDCTVSM
jgi:hypothetical protein